MKLTPIEKRAARKARNPSMVDLNLVSLIDVFTILIFFLLSNSTEVQTLAPARAVRLPVSSAHKAPRQTLVVAVSAHEILVDGHPVADTARLTDTPDELIPALKAALDTLSARQVVRADDAANAHAVTVMGDRQIPYQLLRKVMFTCARAGFTDVSFAVRQEG